MEADAWARRALGAQGDVTTGRVRGFDGTVLAWYATGRGRTLVLAPGVGLSSGVWHHQVTCLADRFRILTWDVRGLRGSARPADPRHLRIEHHAQDLEAILDALDVRDAVLAGWGTGVQVILEHHRRAPLRAAALIAVAGVAGQPWHGSMIARCCGALLPMAQAAVRLLGDAPVERAHALARWPELVAWMRRLRIAAPSVDEELLRTLVGPVSAADVESALRSWRLAGEHDAGDVLRDLRVPLLVLVGEDDRLVSPRAAGVLARRVRQAELFVVPGATHLVTLEHPDLVNLRIEKFLREHQLLGEAPR